MSSSSTSTPASASEGPTSQQHQEERQQQQQQQNNSGGPLPLPEPSKAGDDGMPTQQLALGGTGVKLDHLGPLVVNEDGTLSRIANWGKMADIERENTLRILGRRNKARLAALRARQKDEAADGGQQ
ncbi:hypothetical protein DL764_003679 [Monosporascus ibericus]|uniref:Uncharacterized protein n=1 Tax=Monosporascus ibericus TaxID=155417 RepID=A0A4Q4TGA1_9PEZI|nr:hypothetical protein DL764_003679 [Monosporascus ibericus]